MGRGHGAGPWGEALPELCTQGAAPPTLPHPAHEALGPASLCHLPRDACHPPPLPACLATARPVRHQQGTWGFPGLPAVYWLVTPSLSRPRPPLGDVKFVQFQECSLGKTAQQLKHRIRHRASEGVPVSQPPCSSALRGAEVSSPVLEPLTGPARVQGGEVCRARGLRALCPVL